MKVLFVSEYRQELEVDKAVWLHPVIRHLPCEVVECYSVADVCKHVGTADVALLNLGPRYVTYWEQLSFLSNTSVYVGVYYNDVWDARSWGITPNVHLVSYRTLTKQYKPHWENVFWLPPSMDVVDYPLLRNIDVLFWGNLARKYPFRQFMVKELKGHVVGEGKRVDSFLSFNVISIGGGKYTYYNLKSAHGMRLGRAGRELKGYYGARLYRLLSKARICVTGPGVGISVGAPLRRGKKWGVPVGKYFENAACGIVSLTTDFTDRKALGFEHKKNIWITDKGHFLGDLRFLLEQDDLVQQMSENAKKLIETRHTRNIRAQALHKFLCKRSGKV